MTEGLLVALQLLFSPRGAGGGPGPKPRGLQDAKKVNVQSLILARYPFQAMRSSVFLKTVLAYRTS